MKVKYLILFLLLLLSGIYVWLHIGVILPKVNKQRDNVFLLANTKITKENKQLKRLQTFAKQVLQFSSANHYNTSVCFLVDMKIHSGKNRFFVYDLSADSILTQGLVAHGNCNTGFLIHANFSNEVGCGCTSAGKYVVGKAYQGRFGKAFKLKGLDKTNTNAFARFVVLHAYDCIPDYEIYPMPVCNSLGCPMVSYSFMDKLSNILNKANKPIVLYIFK